ncbi:MAG: VWA domain-containing protein [Kofleriaceae bacterium]
MLRPDAEWSPLRWDWAAIEWVHLMWAVLALVAGLVVLEVRSRGALQRFLSPIMLRRLASAASGARTSLRIAFLWLALVLAVLALMQPQAPGATETVTTSRDAADVMFVLDVSRSMLAEDAAPNRLARAKAEIAQLVEKLGEHRTGLVVFAGRAAPLCPLTPDHAFFGLALAGADPNSVGRGGTRIGEAIRVALRAFPSGPGAKLIVLITDGEDHESYPEDAAKAARDVGVKIVAVGLGSEQGTQIVITDPKTGAKKVVLDGDQPVVTKLDAKTLQQMALLTEGAYIPAGTAAIDLDSIMESYVTPIVRASADASVRHVPAERYPWFILASLACFLAALWIGTGERRTR